MDHYHLQKQKQFSSKSSLLVVPLAIFTGVMIITIPLAPVVVFAASIKGTPDNDVLNGTPKTDTIKGFEGDDKLFGKGGKDILDGGTGSDEIYGGDGNDKIKELDDLDGTNRVYGGSGDDNIDVGTSTGSGDNNYIYGEAGSDYIDIISIDVFVDGGPNDDTIYCKADNYCGLYGNQGDDEIHINGGGEITSSSAYGGSGNDKLYGGGCQDLEGNDGNDYLFGCPNQDGGKGDDVLEEGYSYTGGPGADTFKCSPDEIDVVEDYNPEEGDTVSDDCETVLQG